MQDKPLRIYISKEIWNDAKHTVRDGILHKLSAAKENLTIDTDIAAGIYIYALEEFGKLLLLKDCKISEGRYIIKYRNDFINHRIKFVKAFDYLQNNNFEESIIINRVIVIHMISIHGKIFLRNLLQKLKQDLEFFMLIFPIQKIIKINMI